jgi:hypothetical protein
VDPVTSIPVVAGAVAIITGVVKGGGWALERRRQRRALKAAKESGADPYPVRFTCKGHTHFDPESGYWEVLLFEVFNNSDPPRPVTVKSFRLEFEMHAYDTWHDYEQAQPASVSGFKLPAKLGPYEGLEGWLPADELPEHIAPREKHIVRYYPYVELVGFGKHIGSID